MATTNSASAAPDLPPPPPASRGGSGARPFNADVSENEGYLYTTNASWSAVTANERLTRAALEAVSFEGKKVLDIGCGDGAYTNALYDRGNPSSMVGIDPADSAVRVATKRKGDRRIEFQVGNAEKLPFADNSFDLVHIRGVIHHVQSPPAALREALRVGKQVLVLEPNGFNPVLKVIERASPYHREHQEQSYSPWLLERWCEGAGGRVISGRYVGLVPFFCPKPLAQVLKALEPLFEAAPVAKQASCAVYTLLVEKI